MENKIKDKIEQIEAQKAYVLDGFRITNNLAIEVQQIIRTSFSDAQNTDSIDEKINKMIQGLQDVGNHVIEAHNWVSGETEKLNLKLETLKELLSELESPSVVQSSEESVASDIEELDSSEEESESSDDGEKKR